MLKKASFADLRGAKHFRSVGLAPAVRLEPTTCPENMQVIDNTKGLNRQNR
jgi:hypothetical protein